MTSAAPQREHTGGRPAPPLALATVAAVGYVCATPDDISAELFDSWCRRRAAAGGWVLGEVVFDPDEGLPLAGRPGWQRITAMAAAGSLAAVVTVTRPMIATTAKGWSAAADQLAGHRVSLVTIGSSSCSATGEAR